MTTVAEPDTTERNDEITTEAAEEAAPEAAVEAAVETEAPPGVGTKAELEKLRKDLVGKYVTVTSSDYAKYQGVLIAINKDPDHWRMQGTGRYDLEYVRTDAGQRVRGFTVILASLESGQHNFGWLITNHMDDLLTHGWDLDGFNKMLSDGRRNWRDVGYVELVSISTVAEKLPPPVLRPMDGVYVIGEIDGSPGGGLVEGTDAPKLREMTPNRQYVVIKQGSVYEDTTDDKVYLLFCPYDGNYRTINIDSTRFVRTYRATRKSWCDNRTRPLREMIRWMEREWRDAKIEDQQEGIR